MYPGTGGNDAAGNLSRFERFCGASRVGFRSKDKGPLMKQLVLHIGRHKSGTSAIQMYLAEHRAEYASLGIVIPEFGCEDDTDNDASDRVAHHRLANAFAHGGQTTPSELVAWRDALNNAGEMGRTVVLTSEAFQNCANFSALREFCRGFYVVVICYLREYLDYALSSYAQEIKKNGLSAGFFEFERTFNPAIGAFMRRWDEFANHCHWRIYDPERLAEGDVVLDFLNTAGLPDFGGARYRSENPRIGGSLLGLKLMANAAGLHSRALGRAMEPLASARASFRLPWRLLPETQARMRERRDYNSVLVERFGDLTIRDMSYGALPFASPTLASDFREILIALDDFPALREHPLFKVFMEAN